MAAAAPFTILLHNDQPLGDGYVRYGNYKVLIEEDKVITFGTFSELLSARWNAIVDATSGIEKCEDDISPHLQMLAKFAHMRVREEYFETKHEQKVYLDDYYYDCLCQFKIKELCRRLLSLDDVDSTDGKALCDYFNDIIYDNFYRHLEICIRLCLGKIIIDVITSMIGSPNIEERDCAFIRYAESYEEQKEGWSSIMIQPINRISRMTTAEIDRMVNIRRLMNGLVWNWDAERIIRNMYLYYKRARINVPRDKLIKKLCLYYSLFDHIMFVMNGEGVLHHDDENDGELFGRIMDEVDNVAEQE
jgi:hypothetical protein